MAGGAGGGRALSAAASLTSPIKSEIEWQSPSGGRGCGHGGGRGRGERRLSTTAAATAATATATEHGFNLQRRVTATALPEFRKYFIVYSTQGRGEDRSEQYTRAPGGKEGERLMAKEKSDDEVFPLSVPLHRRKESIAWCSGSLAGG